MRVVMIWAGAVTAIGAAALPAPASAAFLTPSGFSAQGWADDASIAVSGSLSDVVDADTTTGLTFTATRPVGASGVRGDFAYDISGFTGITGFALTAKIVADFGPITDLNSVRLGSNIQLLSGFILVDTPSGSLVTATLSPVAGGTGVNDLSRYVSGATLTLAFATDLASNPVVGTPISISFRELSLELFTDVVVQPPVAVPAPASLPLFAAFLGMGALALARRKPRAA